MALEPITRQEKIISGENLKPITRMEMFLKEFGGGGSGGSGGVSPDEVTAIVKEQFPGGVGYEEVQTVNEPLNITWDGNTEGLVRVGEKFFKVSDVVLTDEQIKTSTLFANTGFGLPVIDKWDSAVEAGMVTEDVVAVGEGLAIFVRRPGSVMGPVVFPEVGVYFAVINAETYISGLTTAEPIEQTKVVTKKLDAKYLPDGVGGSGGGIKTAIMKLDGYDNNLAGVAAALDVTEYSYTCLNMSYEEAMQIMSSGEPLSIFIMGFDNFGAKNYYSTNVCLSAYNPLIIFDDPITSFPVTWGNKGVSTLDTNATDIFD